MERVLCAASQERVTPTSAPAGTRRQARPVRAAVAGLLFLALTQVSCQDDNNRQASGLQQPVGGRCLNSGDQVEREAVVEFFAAFNAGSVGRAERVAQLTELWETPEYSIPSAPPTATH